MKHGFFCVSVVRNESCIYIITLLVTPLRAGTPEAMVAEVELFLLPQSGKGKGWARSHLARAIMAAATTASAAASKAVVSRLVQTLQPGADPHMPPKDQLSPRAIAALETWVNDGAPWDAEALKDRPSPKRDQLDPLPPSYAPSLALALSADGKRLAVGRANGVMVHDLENNNAVLATLAGHRDTVQALAWSADGKWLASSDYRSVRLWTAELKPAGEILPLRDASRRWRSRRITVALHRRQPTSCARYGQWSVAERKPLADWVAMRIPFTPSP